ncbi:hypothetical protein J8M20_24400 [Pseudoalteromonas luteoviolacea]|uniref:hypothetical protein n=1 Tax=Pseudoalteromonas luteoviolacea TaxID=43657 RepID=UPI001B36F6C1|nr:hypothetical protein [Pseudoalteromonas luteoviolacea]MBQ4814528.1 hypothetical protein [Pseudoalteromonas luteoviolacea]
MKIKLLLALLLFLSPALLAGKKLGLTAFNVYDRGNGKFELQALHVLKGGVGSELVEFKLCGKSIFVKGVHGQSRVMIDECEVDLKETSVALYYENDKVRSLYEHFQPENCFGTDIYSSVRRESEDSITVYLADFPAGEFVSISTSSGLLLDRFRTIVGCSYFQEFSGLSGQSELMINDVLIKIE